MDRVPWHRHAVVVGLALVAFTGSAPARADPVEIDLAPPAPPQAKRVPVEDVVTGKATLKIAGTATKVELYTQNTSSVARAANSCLLDVQSDRTVALNADTLATADKAGRGQSTCRNLLTSAETVTLAASAPGSTAHALIELEGPADYQGAGGKFPYELASPETKAPKWPLPLPSAVHRVNDTCYVHVGSWLAVPCADGKLNPSETVRAVINAHVSAGNTALWFAVQVIDASGPTKVWRRLQATAPESKPPVPPDFVLDDACKTQIAADIKDSLAPANSFHAICVDANKPGTPHIQTWRVPGDRPAVPERGDNFRLRAGLPVVVYAWYPASVKSVPTIDMDGPTGEAPRIYDPNKARTSAEIAKLPVAADSPKPLLARREFGRQIGPKTNLLVEIKLGTSADSEKASVKREYVIETFYCGAVRIGIGASWTPWARELGIRTSASGVRYAAVTGGDGAVPGLFGAELVLGYSFFLTGRMSDLHPKPAFGVNVGLGVLEQTTKVEGLTSLRAGIEVAYGLDFSLALQAGIRRHDIPKDDLKPGTPIPSGVEKIETQFGITPTFGLVLNVTPSLLKSAGLTIGD